MHTLCAASTACGNGKVRESIRVRVDSTVKTIAGISSIALATESGATTTW